MRELPASDPGGDAASSNSRLVQGCGPERPRRAANRGAELAESHASGEELVDPLTYDSAAAAGRAAADVRLHAGSAPAPEDDPVLVSDAGVLG